MIDKKILETYNLTFSKYEDAIDKLINHRKEDGARGLKTPFQCLNKHYTIKDSGVTDWTGLPGSGKCMGKGTKVIMHDSTLKNIEDIVVGDKICGPNGSIRTVLSLARGKENMYKIKQNNGIDYVVNESHILSLKRKTDQITRGKKSKNNKRGDILNISVKDYINSKSTVKEYFRGWNSWCYFEDKEVLIDPYYLGLWLGDGSSGTPVITTKDPEIVDFIEKYSKEINCKMSTYDYKNRCKGYAIVDNYGFMKNKLRQYDLLNNKHIPKDYINNSFKKRTELLAGIIDSDGHVYNNGHAVEIVQKNKKLAEQIKFLFNTLGFRSSITKKISTMNRSDGSIYKCETYVIYSSGDLSIIPTLVERKKMKSLKYGNDRYTGIEVEFVGFDDYYGFTLDGDSLYLLEDGTVTHNTYFCLEVLISAALKYGKRYALYVPDIGNEIEIYDKLFKMFTGFDFHSKYRNQIPEELIYRYMNEIIYRFPIFKKKDRKKGVSPQEVWEFTAAYKDESGEGLSGVLIDSWKNLKHSYSGREDLYLDEVLSYRNEIAEEENIHIHTIAHASKTETNKDGKRRIPTASDIKGGEAWNANGKNIITVDYPDKSRTGVNIFVNKVKPESVGSVGSIVNTLYLDRKRGRYFEFINSFKRYAYDYEKLDFGPSDELDVEEDKMDVEDLPDLFN